MLSGYHNNIHTRKRECPLGPGITVFGLSGHCYKLCSLGCGDEGLSKEGSVQWQPFEGINCQTCSQLAQLIYKSPCLGRPPPEAWGLYLDLPEASGSWSEAVGMRQLE